MEEFFKTIMFLGFIIGLVFILITNLSPNRKDKSILYLNLFVLFFILNNLQITLADYHYLPLNFFQRKLLIPFYVLIIPCFYTFVTYYLKAEKKIQSFVVISSVLFLIEVVIRIVLAFLFYDDRSNFFVAKYAQIEEIINVFFTLFLYFKVVYIFFNQSKLYENISSFDNMNWIKKFLLFGFIILLLWVFAIVFNYLFELLCYLILKLSALIIALELPSKEFLHLQNLLVLKRNWHPKSLIRHADLIQHLQS